MPNQFYIFASQFSQESILTAISFWSYELYNNPNKNFKMFGANKGYNFIRGDRRYKGKVTLYQTNLVDIMYDICKYERFGLQTITKEEALYLIHLHVGLESERRSSKEKHTDFMLRLYGNLGEQAKIQGVQALLKDFVREKYILETISKRDHKKNKSGIDFEKDFLEETSMLPTEYSALIFAIFVFFATTNGTGDVTNIVTGLNNPLFSKEKIEYVLNRYTVAVDDVKNSKMERQIFYQKPIIKAGGLHISVNPFWLLSTLVNSNFWIIRNKYKNDKKDSQRFTNAFGEYFEIYLEEIFERCLSKEQYKEIEKTNKGQRADWYLKIGDYNFLIEQKSSISMLEIKQSHPNVETMKKHIVSVWGEAVEQLEETQKFYKLDNAIKIILVYENYYNSECLEFLFDLNSELTNDNQYWLVPICDFENLMYTYKTDPKKFFKIVAEKDEAEQTQSKYGRNLSKFFENNGVDCNSYLKGCGMFDEFDGIQKLFW